MSAAPAALTESPSHDLSLQLSTSAPAPLTSILGGRVEVAGAVDVLRGRYHPLQHSNVATSAPTATTMHDPSVSVTDGDKTNTRKVHVVVTTIIHGNSFLDDLVARRVETGE